MPVQNEVVKIALQRLGVDPNKLGVVMLNVDLPEVYLNVLDPSWAFSSNKLSYVKGYDGQSHITLLYGLIFSARLNIDLIDGMLEGWQPPSSVIFDEVDVFRNNDGEFDYGALVLRPSESRRRAPDIVSLEEANGRLSNLPHVRSFVKYNPHITIGYVRKEFISQALQVLRILDAREIVTSDLVME